MEPVVVDLATSDDAGERRHAHALELHDNVVQGLVIAKLHLELGDTDKGMAGLETTLASARRLVTVLLDENEPVPLAQPGTFRRSGPRPR